MKCFVIKNSYCTFPGPDSLSWRGWRWGCWTARKSSSKGKKQTKIPLPTGNPPPKKKKEMATFIFPSRSGGLPQDFVTSRGGLKEPLCMEQYYKWGKISFDPLWSFFIFEFNTTSNPQQKKFCKKIHVRHRKGKTSTPRFHFTEAKKYCNPKIDWD